jgi:hypothetical protein
LTAIRFILLLLLTLFCLSISRGQDVPHVPADTLRAPRADTLRTDTLKTDTTRRALEEKTGVDTVVNYSADQIDFEVERRITHLIGNAVISYKDMKLSAGVITVDWDAHTMTALPLPDTLWTDSAHTEIDSIGEVGKPHFAQGQEDFVGEEIAYNMQTKIGRVRGGSTTYEQGYYYGKQFKRLANQVITVSSGDFTSCEKNPPDYHFHAGELKVIVGKRVIARPVILYFEDVPVMALPFGIFPQQKGRTSGILVPVFGESSSQGRFLRDIGYYWAISDYMDARASIDYYEKFGILGRGNYRYSKRYSLNGGLDYNFNTQRIGAAHRRDFSIMANHQQTINENTQLNFSGGYVSNKSFNENVGSVQDLLNQSINSNATLSKRWYNSPWSMSANLGYQQNLNSNTWSSTLPGISLTHASGLLFPGPKADPSLRGSAVQRELHEPWYRRFTWSYGATYRNELSFPKLPKEQGLKLGPLRLNGTSATPTTIYGTDSTQLFQRDGLTHSGGISAQAKVLNYLGLNPRINITSLWMRSAVRYVADGKLLRRDDERGFFQRTTFDIGTSASTKLYGLSEKPLGIGASFRHVMSPSVSFTYRPDFGKKFWDYYTTATLPDGRKYTYDRFPSTATVSGGGTPTGLSERIGLGLSHLFQMKTMGKNQTEDQQKKFDLLAWDMNSGVDLRRDSLKWDNLGMSWRTTIPGKLIGPIEQLGFDVSTTHSLYEYVNPAGGIPYAVNTFYWDRSGGKWYQPIKLLNANFNVSFSISADPMGSVLGLGRKKKAEADSSEQADTTGYMFRPPSAASGLLGSIPPPAFPTGPVMRGPSELYQMPLTLAVNIHEARDYVNYSKTSGFGVRATMSLTPRWSMNMDYNFDLDRKKVNNVNVFVTRDLHCWEASIQWSPLGYRPGYYLRIGLKSPQLKDVKIERHKGAGLAGPY